MFYFLFFIIDFQLYIDEILIIQMTDNIKIGFVFPF